MVNVYSMIFDLMKLKNFPSARVMWAQLNGKLSKKHPIHIHKHLSAKVEDLCLESGEFSDSLLYIHAAVKASINMIKLT